MKLTLAQIARAIAAEPVAGGDAMTASGYSIDSRTLQPGDLFFAMRGENFDGHAFVGKAFENGACCAVVAKNGAEGLPHRERLLVVEDPLAALQRLAAGVRRSWGKRVVGITGSAGKTTTKEAVAAVLPARFSALKSQGNLNNHYGVPLQLLRLKPENEVAIIEMGMSAAGEIAALCRIAAPDWGVVTNVGHAHAEKFSDGIAGIARAKYELVAALPRQGVAFLNCDDPYVSQFGRGFEGKVVYFGRGPCADPRIDSMEALGAEGVRLQVRSGGEKAEMVLRLPGEHNASNAMAAIAVGIQAGIPLATCCEALATLEPDEKRGRVTHLRGATIINDCYNSNPEALKSMTATLKATPAKRRILVAGEMLELGPEAPSLHAACGKAAAQAGIDVVIGVRGNAQHIVDGAQAGRVDAHFVETPEAAGEWLREHLQEGDAVLLKASRGVRLERALAVLTGA